MEPPATDLDPLIDPADGPSRPPSYEEGIIVHAQPRPMIDGLLHAAGVHLLTSPADADLVACREAVLAAMVGSLATGSPCLGREPERQGLSLIASSGRFAARIAERLELWSELTALRLPEPVFAHLGDGFAPAKRGGRQAGEGEVLDDLEPALVIVAAGGLVLPKPATSTVQARRIVDRLRPLAPRARASPAAS